MFFDTLTHLKEDDQPTALDLAMHAYLLDARARRLSPKTLSYHQEQLGPFLRFLRPWQVETPGEIRAHHIRKYLVSLQERGLKDTSQHAAARSIRAFCNWMVVEEILESSPMRMVQMPRLDKRILPAFSKEDVNTLLANCTNPRDVSIVLCLLDSGCRLSEFVSLHLDDVDVRSGAVTVRHGKGGKDRVTFIGTKARKSLMKYLMTRRHVNADDPLWPSFNTGKSLTPSGLRLILYRLGKRSGVEHCHAHTFRRTSALWSLRAGMNIFVLQQMMGHSDLTTLRRYLALVDRDVETAHRQHGPVDNTL